MVEKREINHLVFWPPFLLLVITAAISVIAPVDFLDGVRTANAWIITNFQHWFSWSTFSFLILLIIAYISPFGTVRIGGKGASPILSKGRLFSITLCSTVAIGILFWASAEPIYHLHQSGIVGMTSPSVAARNFAMSTLFLHWTFTPYAIYAIGAIVFAYVFYNKSRPFSVGSYLFPLFGRPVSLRIAYPLDAICLYSLVAGISANLGVGILSISGGLRDIFALPPSNGLLIVVVVVIVGTFIISSVSGLQNGIRRLSMWNLRGFMILFLLVVFTAPMYHIMLIGWDGLKEYLITFPDRSVNYSKSVDPEWSQNWTTFYWANWLAWAPITCLFLGYLGKGYSIRTLIRFNLLYPALFSMLWMMVFGGFALYLDTHSDEFLMNNVLESGGPEKVIYALFGSLPHKTTLVLLFLMLAFLSFVTAADSATTAMSNISYKGVDAASAESPILIKVLWGVLVGMIAVTMVLLAGIDGIKMISNLGGLPALFIFIVIALGLLRLVVTSFGRSPE